MATNPTATTTGSHSSAERIGRRAGLFAGKFQRDFQPDTSLARQQTIAMANTIGTNSVYTADITDISRPAKSAIKGQEFQDEVWTIRSLGDLKMRIVGGKETTNFWDVERPRFSIERGPAWLKIASEILEWDVQQR